MILFSLVPVITCPGITALSYSRSCPGYNSLIPFLILSWFYKVADNVVELVGGGSVINEATPSSSFDIGVLKLLVKDFFFYLNLKFKYRKY